jgi:RNA polymerase-binding transcription factor DksA
MAKKVKKEKKDKNKNKTKNKSAKPVKTKASGKAEKTKAKKNSQSKKASKTNVPKKSSKNLEKKETKNKKSGTTMKKKETKKVATKEKSSSSKKETKPKTTKTSVSKIEEKTKLKSQKKSEKPKKKKDLDYEEKDELLNDEEILDEDDEVSEVEEIDLSNIDPVIADVEPILEDEEEEEYVPKTRGRKKQVQQEVHHQLTMEEIIRNRPLQIDPTKKTYVVKKNDEPKPYIAPTKGNKERYTDKELQEFKEIILQKLKETKENYDQLKKFFSNEDNNGTDDTSPTFKMIEDGSGVMTKEEIEQQLSRLEKYMVDLQNALLRIENKTYGICTVTGKLIPKERLKLVPHATKSIEAKINRD